MTDIRVNVWKVLYDSQTGASVVLLQTESEEHVLPIWVGQSEALSIAVASENVTLDRPMTHDLMKTVLDTGEMTLEWVRIHDLREGTFYADMRLSRPEGKLDIDARPSDAIALALRCEAPVFVTERVLAEVLRDSAELPEDISNLSEDFLASLPDDRFGKYKM